MTLTEADRAFLVDVLKDAGEGSECMCPYDEHDDGHTWEGNTLIHPPECKIARALALLGEPGFRR